MDETTWEPDLEKVLFTKEQLDERLEQMAAEIDADYAGEEVLLVGVLKGAVMVMADLARKLHTPASMDWMAISSYGSGTKSSGVVRILKDLDTDILGKNVLVVEDIVDSGLTLSWLMANLETARAEVAADRRPAAQAGCREGRDQGGVRRLRHPQRVRHRLRAGLRPRSTATCPSSGPSPRTSTAEPPPAGLTPTAHENEGPPHRRYRWGSLFGHEGGDGAHAPEPWISGAFCGAHSCGWSCCWWRPPSGSR